jgi:dephospho-CoA kinase
MLKIGLTGGIGSGKTTIAQIFEVLGIPVYYADTAAKDLMNRDPELRNRIISAFGPEVYKEGSVDRAYLGELVFGDPEKLARLNAIVHPATLLDAAGWMQNQKTPYVIKEAALIYEAGLEKFLDYIICVTAPESLRLERVMNRDRVPAEKVLQRMQQQMDEKEKVSRCDFVIINDGKQALLPQVLAIHETLMEKAKTGL